MASNGMIATPWGGFMPTDAGLPDGTGFMTLPKAQLPAGATGGLEENVPAAQNPEAPAPAPAPKQEKKGAPAFTNEQLAMLNSMMKVAPDANASRTASGGVSMGARPQVQMAQLQPQAVAARPSLAQLLYGRR